MIGPCLIAPDTFRADRQNARGLRARGAITVLGGLRAEAKGDAMSVEVTHPGFVTVAGDLEPSAVAGHIARDAHNRVAEAVTLTLDWLEDEGNPLNQTQKVQFVECVLRCMDGFERSALDEIMQAIERANDAR